MKCRTQKAKKFRSRLGDLTKTSLLYPKLPYFNHCEKKILNVISNGVRKPYRGSLMLNHSSYLGKT